MATGSPTTFGTVASLPCDTTNATLDPGATFVPGAGLVEMTSPFGTLELAWYVTVPTANWSAPSLLDADASERPTTFGTAIELGPLETVRTTVEPCGADVPPVGDSATTVPCGALAA